MTTWLNWACLGEQSAGRATLGFQAQEDALIGALGDCISWISTWTGRPESDVFLTSSATEACDMLLRVPTDRRPHWLLTTNHVFASIDDATDRYRHLLERLCGDVRMGRVTLEPLLGLTEAEFATGFADAVNSVTQGVPSVCIVEHVTSLLGLRLPIAAVQKALRESDCRLIVDAAQSVGIWPCPIRNEAYFGCFHKYLNCPAGTGFGVLPNDLHGYLPASAVTLKKLSRRPWCLPTQDADRWIECAARLRSCDDLATVAQRALALRDLLARAFEANVCPRVTTVDSAYRSHIIALDLVSAQRAQQLWRRLEKLGFRTKQDEQLLRVSLHHSLTADDVQGFAKALTQALAEE